MHAIVQAMTQTISSKSPPPTFIYPSSTDSKSCTTNCKNYKSTTTVVSSKTKKSTFYISFLCFRGSLNKFFSNCNGLKPDLNKRFTDDCVGATSSKREKLHQLIASVNSLNSVLKCSWETSQKLLVFLEIKFLDNDHAYLLTCTTKQQILITAVCCTRPLIHNVSSLESDKHFPFFEASEVQL